MKPPQEVECSNHPDAPHGFCRDASHTAGRYVCECEGWQAKQPAQDYVLICKRCGDDLGIEYVPDEQSAQEPVALIKHENGNYSPKHQWQGLTDNEQQEPYAYAYVREDGVGQLCWTKRDVSLFKDLLNGWKEIPLYTKEKNHE